MFHLEQAIKQWRQQFQKHPAFDDGSLQEMELHLRDQLDDLIAEGLTEEQAFLQAAQSFGKIEDVANEAITNIMRKPTIKTLLFRAMINNYFKSFSRNMLKHPLTSIINVLGLAVAIGICLVVYLFYDWDKSLDQFHEHKNEVYLTTFFVNREGTEQQYGTSPAPMGKMMTQDFPQIEKMCRIVDAGAVVKYEENVFNERIRYVDPAFLDVFTFPLKWGMANSLKDANSIVLSEEVAKKYFKDENPVGQNMLIKFSETTSKTFRVGGVAKAFPDHHIIDFDMLINFDNIKIAKPDFEMNDWEEMVAATLIKVGSAEEMKEVRKGVKKYLDLQHAANSEWPISSFEFVKLADLHFEASHIRNSISHDYNGEARLGMPIIALFMVVMACLNYINISITSAVKRLKEIGLRKVIGARRSAVMSQFLIENLFMTAFAALIGLLLGATVFMPWFCRLSGDAIHFNPADPFVWIFTSVVILLTGILSGAYPSVYISKFQAVEVFRGSVKFGQKNVATKIFLGLQLVITCIGITNAIVFSQNSTYQKQRSWGYEKEDVLYSYVGSQSAYTKLYNAMRQEPSVKLLAGAKNHLGQSSETKVVEVNDREYEVQKFEVSPNYFETMGIPFNTGQSFASDGDKLQLVVNEKFMKNLGLMEMEHAAVTIDSVSYRIVGIVEDVHSQSFSHKIKPTIFQVIDKDDVAYLVVKANEDQTEQAYTTMKNKWAVLFPETPYAGRYQEDIWRGFFNQVAAAQKFYRVIASIAVLLASLGLYGLVNLNVESRIKEFSVRKVLGANTKSLLLSLGKQYFWLLLISLVFGIPFSYIMAKLSLEMLWSYPMPMNISGVLFAGILLTFVVGFVIFTQMKKLLQADPVAGLKTE